MIREEATTGILRELVGIPTPSMVSNLPLLRWVTEWLEARGWAVEMLPYVDEAGVDKSNLIARPSDSAAPIELAFVCHSDTVPYDAGWPGALKLEERDGMLHGCGACDVKGSLAGFLGAVARVERDQVAPGIALILTADEEIGCKGMERLLAAERLAGVRIGSAVVSEPTSLRAGVSGKGYGLARVTVEGREAHSAFPGQGVSAISLAARLVVAMEQSFVPGMRDGLFDPPYTTVNIGVIEGGTAKNIVPGRCTFLVEWRAIPEDDPAEIVARLRAVVAGVQAKEERARVSLEVLRAERGFSAPASGPLQRRLGGLLAAEPVGTSFGVSFGSEASRVARIADEVIVIGPGDMQTAHSDRECVSIDELERWTAVLAELIRG